MKTEKPPPIYEVDIQDEQTVCACMFNYNCSSSRSRSMIEEGVRRLSPSSFEILLRQSRNIEPNC